VSIVFYTRNTVHNDHLLSQDVRPSVCPSRSDIVSKQLNISLNLSSHLIVPSKLNTVTKFRQKPS